MAQQGFQYEINACDVLKPMGFVPQDFRPAGAGHNQPDLMLLYKNKEAGCELKITAASAGSLVLKYDSPIGGMKIGYTTGGKNPWSFGKIEQGEDEKQFISSLAQEVGIFNRIAKEWPEEPLKREKKDDKWKATAGKMTPKERYERDRDTFKDIIGEIPATKIEEYYVKKHTYYVNVGTHGFYLMGNQNPLGLQGVPRFGTSASATYRARVQYKGSGNYQFTFEMQFRMRSKSPFNIAPVNGKSVEIIKSQLNLSCFT